MMTAEQRDVFDEILCGARDEFEQAYQDEADHSEACSEQIENLSFAVELAEIGGLDRICAEIGRSITDLTDKAQLRQLVNWADEVIEFIRTPDSEELAQKLAQYVPEHERDECVRSLLPRKCEEDKPKLSVAPNVGDETQDALVSELEPLKAMLNKTLDEIFGASDAKALEVLKERYCESVHCLADTVRTLNLSGLGTLCDLVIENVNLISTAWLAANRSQGFLVFQQWPGLVLTYLNNPKDDEHCLALINHFELQGWPSPLNDDGARALLESLLESGFIDGFFTSSSQIFSANPEDMSLASAAELNADLFDAFLHDAPNQSAELSACVSALGGGPQDVPCIQQAQRLTHTLKGAANVVGLVAIANMAHVLEELFERLCRSPEVLSKELMVLLQSSSDCMEAMVDYLQGKDSLPEDRFSLYQQLVVYLNQANKPRASNDANISVDLVEAEPQYIAEHEGLDTTRPHIESNQVETVRVPLNVISALFQLAEEMTIALGSSQEQTQRILEQLAEVNKQDWRVQEQRFELENAVDVRGAASRQRKHAGDTVGSDFDSLEMDQYDEIYDVAHALIESVSDARELNNGVAEQIKSLDSLMLQQTRLNKELQLLIKRTRMISVRSVVPRLQRGIRHAARITGKLIDFEVLGVETEINEDVLEKLIDPIMHLLRNAVDHGIEEAQVRISRSKPIEGRVQLRFGQDGQNITITCDDDGAGIDVEKVRNKAINLGLIGESEPLSPVQVRQLILRSGFSTKDSANQVSGRGIGMDAVNRRIRDLGGLLRIDNGESGGTRFEVKVPLQLVASNALLVEVQKQWFAIPTRQIELILAPGSAQSTLLGEHAALTFEDNVYLSHQLGDLIGYRPLPDGMRGPVLLTSVSSEPAALHVDAVLANQDLVIKSTGDYVKNVPGVAGVSILGDGRLVPVLDLSALLERKQAAPAFISEWTGDEDSEEYHGDEASVLIVDDSLSVRKSLSQLVGDAGYGCDTARDGMEAWDKILQKKPSVILVDMEMPRMNGIELTTRIRANEHTRDIPVVMITSRSMQKHRNAAEKAGINLYVTKPFAEAELLTQIHGYVQAGQEGIL